MALALPAARDDPATTPDEVWLPGRRIPEHWWGYLLVAPAMLMVMGLILYPVSTRSGSASTPSTPTSRSRPSSA